MRARSLSVGLVAVIASIVSYQAIAGDQALKEAVAGPQRSPNMAARDQYRHPIAELEFFGIRPTMTVVEIWPEGGYWTEILAPYLHDHGTYYAAVFDNDWGAAVSDATTGGPEQNIQRLKQSMERYNEAFRAKLDANRSIYDKVHVVGFGKNHYDIVPPGSADMVLSFRNIHNWMSPVPFADEAFAAFYRALRPGGVLGVEEHRGRTDQPQDPKAASGYVRQDYAIQLAEKAGFQFVGASEINANPKDTKNWPAGVWTLPPVLMLGAQDRDKYLAIGEADNFVLKFVKPVR
jgi:predicted methyltransferase